jgi:hypothetical protein
MMRWGTVEPSGEPNLVLDRFNPSMKGIGFEVALRKRRLLDRLRDSL